MRWRPVILDLALVVAVWTVVLWLVRVRRVRMGDTPSPRALRGYRVQTVAAISATAGKSGIAGPKLAGRTPSSFAPECDALATGIQGGARPEAGFNAFRLRFLACRKSRLSRHQPPPRTHCCASLNIGVVVGEGILEPHPARHHSVAAIPTIPRTMGHRSSATVEAKARA